MVVGEEAKKKKSASKIYGRGRGSKRGMRRDQSPAVYLRTEGRQRDYVAYVYMYACVYVCVCYVSVVCVYCVSVYSARAHGVREGARGV
jgi:hypothetical protein